MRYVVIGSGNISTTYVAALKKITGAQLVACVSRSGKRPANALSIPCYLSLADVTETFDAVIVAIPNSLHHPAIIEAARLGKHVLTEKPLATTREGMEAALAACRDADVTLGVAFQHRAAPDNRAIKTLLDEGAFGRIYAADLSCKFWRDQAYYDSAEYRGTRTVDGGGVFIQQACHNIDLYVWFFGMPRRVDSMLATFAHRMESEDHGAVLLRYDNGMIGTITASTATRPGFPARLEVHCEKGSFTMTDDRITVWEIDGMGNPTDTSVAYSHDGARSMAVTDTSMHEAIIADFEIAVLNRCPPLVDGASARLTSELIMKIYEKA